MPKILAEYTSGEMPIVMRCKAPNCAFNGKPAFYRPDQIAAAKYMAETHTSAMGHHTIVEDLRED